MNLWLFPHLCRAYEPRLSSFTDNRSSWAGNVEFGGAYICWAYTVCKFIHKYNIANGFVICCLRSFATLSFQCATMREMLCFLVVLLVPQSLASMCIKRDFCHYPDTKLLGVPFIVMPTHDIHIGSCLSTCLYTDDCRGVTLDPLGEMCHLYAESTSFEIAEAPGTNLWLSQAAGVPCIMVSNYCLNDSSAVLGIIRYSMIKTRIWFLTYIDCGIKHG